MITQFELWSSCPLDTLSPNFTPLIRENKAKLTNEVERLKRTNYEKSKKTRDLTNQTEVLKQDLITQNEKIRTWKSKKRKFKKD